MQQSFDAICRRAGGRRRYNKERRALAFMRQLCILNYLDTHGYQRGMLAELARIHGVHRSTISRDVRRWFGNEGWERRKCKPYLLLLW